MIRSAEGALSQKFLLNVGVAGLDHGRLLLRLYNVHLSSLGDGRQARHSGLSDVVLNSPLVGRVDERVSSLLGLGSVDLLVLGGHLVSDQIAVVPLVAGQLHLVLQEVLDLMLRHTGL